MDDPARFLPREALDSLLDAIRSRGYPRVLGPVASSGTLQYREIASAAELPRGLRDQQSPGRYRLEPSADPRRLFSWANGPQALKPLTFAPREIVWRCKRNESGGLEFEAIEPDAPGTAVLGVRACDLAALRLQERHFLRPPHPDAHFAARRASLFLIAVHCSHPAETCFCSSTGDGPGATSGFDLALSELDSGFVVTVGSESGQRMLEPLALAPATPEEVAQAEAEIKAAAAAQTRTLPSRDLRSALYSRLEHPHWEQVGARCLSCGNCTAVCPTCFCHSEPDAPSFDGVASDHLRQWDSCFTATHSYVGHVVLRRETRLRYRQWLTHKLAAWHEQYGRSGCVGCGRCISWCPAGIDPTAEVSALLETDDARP